MCSWVWQTFLRTQKTTGHKIIDQLGLIKIKNNVLLRRGSANEKTSHRLRKNFCKNIYLIKDWYQEYIKNSHKSVVRKKWPNH